jgi:phosphate transport system substrate-binding protein
MSKTARTIAAIGAVMFLSGMTNAADGVKPDPRFPDYTPVVENLTGEMTSMGSDTMHNMMTLWGEEFARKNPNTRVVLRGKGSGTAFGGLLAGIDVGPITRPMKPHEIEALREKFGFPPVQLATSVDMLGVFVHADNPMESLSLPQLDAIFSSTRRLGHTDDIRTWGQLGLEGEWAEAPIRLYGRHAPSGTYTFFKKAALGKGDYKESMREQPGSSVVVHNIAGDKFGIGYSGIGYLTKDVRFVPLIPDDASKPVPPTMEHVDKYPLGRPLWLTVKYPPGGKLEPIVGEFVRLIYSRQGQQIVIKDGYLPMSFDMAVAEAKKVGIELQPAPSPKTETKRPEEGIGFSETKPSSGPYVKTDRG